MTTSTLTSAREAVDRAVGLMPTLDLGEVTAAADLQTRTDRKYLVPAADFLTLTRELDGTLAVLEIEGRRTFDYESVYFDTPELLAYHAHAHGRRRRFKVRTRTYLDSGQCALEIKTEGGRGETVKDRHPYTAADRYLLDAGARALVGAAVGSQPLADRLQTSLVTRYARTTVVDTHTRSRMTCDVDLAFSDDSRRLTGPGGMVLVESKTVGAAGQVDAILWRLGHRPVALSKYCAGLALLDARLPANRWNRTLRRSFGWRPADRMAGWSSGDQS